MARIIVSTVPRVDDGNYRIQGFPDIGVSYVAGALDAAGHEVINCDPASSGVDLEAFAVFVAEKKPLFVGLGCYTLDMYNLGLFARKLRELSPETPIVLGGSHPSTLPELTMEQYPEVDFIVIREGEATVVELAEALEKGGDLGTVTGLVWRNQGETVINAPRASIPNLDEIPMPYYENLPLDNYEKFYNWDKSSVLPMLSARGCPYECIFCYRTQGRSMRYRSHENVIAEIKRNLELYGKNRVTFVDDTFTANVKKVRALAQAMIDEGLHEKIEWYAETRVDLMDKETLELLYRAGCRYLQIGIESGNEDTLKAVKKKIVLDEAVQAVRWCDEIGIKTLSNWILGHPHETVEQMNKTINFARRVNATYAQFLLMTPYPGTEIWEMLKRGEGGYRLLSSDWRDFGKVSNIAMELDTVPAKMLMHMQRKAYWKFYMRPSRFFRLFEVVRFSNVVNYAIYETLRGIKAFFTRDKSRVTETEIPAAWIDGPKSDGDGELNPLVQQAKAVSIYNRITLN